MTEHEQSIEILKAIALMLEDIPGTLKEHKQRIASINYLQERLQTLHLLEDSSESQPE